MAAIALYDWNTAVHHIMFPSTHQIKMGFIADTRGPGLLAKHIVWTLDELFDIFVEYQKFLPGSAEIDWVPVRPAAPYSFGVASVQSVSVSSSQPSASDALAENVAASVSQKGSDIIPSQATSSLIPILALPGLEQGNSSIIPLSLISEAPDGPTNLSASPKVDVVFRFRPHGVIFQVSQVYNASQKLLIKIAEKDVSATVPSLFSTYNDMNDFTYSFRPLRVSAGDKVSYYTCVLAIQMIPHLMWHKGGPTGRWTEIDGRLLVDRIDSARFCIEKGDKTRLNPEDVCTIEPPPIGDDGGIVATA